MPYLWRGRQMQIHYTHQRADVHHHRRCRTIRRCITLPTKMVPPRRVGAFPRFFDAQRSMETSDDCVEAVSRSPLHCAGLLWTPVGRESLPFSPVLSKRRIRNALVDATHDVTRRSCFRVAFSEGRMYRPFVSRKIAIYLPSPRWAGIGHRVFV